MPDIYTGTDIVHIPRIRTILDTQHRQRFLDRLFTKSEQEYCQSKPDSAVHYAGRFAAKEAIKKCLLQSGLTTGIPFIALEIIANRETGPQVHLHLRGFSRYPCRVSISHDGEYAIACAIFILE